MRIHLFVAESSLAHERHIVSALPAPSIELNLMFGFLCAPSCSIVSRVFIASSPLSYVGRRPREHLQQIRTQGSYVRKCLSTRDGGRCAECGIDAAGLYQRARAAWASGVSLSAKREAVAREMVGTPFEGKV